MEFLKGLEVALAMGLSKEEFTDIWKIESKTAGELPSYGDSLLTTRPQVAKPEAKATLVDYNGHAASVDVQRLEAYNHHFLSQFQNMCNLLADKQEEQWKQLRHTHDHMMEELGSRFSLLSDHVSNVVDCNTNSMKVFIMRELGLFQQELGQIIHKRGINQGCERERSNMSTEVQKLASVDISGCRTSEALSSEDELEKDGQSKRSTTQEPLGTVQRQTHLSEFSVQQQRKVQNGIPIKMDESEEGVKNITQLTDTKYINGKVDSNAITTADVDVCTNLHNSPLAISGFNAPSVQCTNAGPFKSRMFYRTTESEKKQSSSRNTSSAGSFLAGTGSSVTSAEDNTDTPTDTVSELLSTSPVLTVTMSELLSASPVFTVTVTEQKGFFLSPTMCCSGVPCNARVWGIFDEDGALNISLYVLRSEHDGNHKSPLVLSGSGHVFHHGSKSYTPVWQLLPAVCQKPLSTNGAYVYSCVVCLSTVRGNYPNVTYKQLVLSKFIEKDTLTMKCTLSARLK